ncbi:hypothetical protein [Paenibacillus contaminans]|uniref:Uncharacterized protein n=1 Tax=Paenibacillus contaminans TaxID=450362 RepID=A0A329MKE3_9BACL|nr:hypothetical protein [Paenibacillus contaminans]RAV20319.1 hypothetical protein DQG23_15195 [Paenibacillus contaminans]
MDQLTAFLQDRWLVVVIAVVVLFLIVKLVKTVIKWVLVLAILAVVIVYGATYKDKLLEVTDTIGTAVTNEIKDQALKAVTNEAKDATYKKNDDGSYTVSTKSIRIDATPGSNDAKITFMGQTFNLKIDEALQKVIDQAKQK